MTFGKSRREMARFRALLAAGSTDIEAAKRGFGDLEELERGS
jgi:hypothetical protein